MPRPIYTYRPTWLDASFKKAFKKLDKRRQERCMKELSELMDALTLCKHPATDPILKRWRPTNYGGLVPNSALYEYRCGLTMRVVAKFCPPSPDSEECFLMLAVTLQHDHEKIQRLIRQHRSGIKDWWHSEE